MNGYDIRLNEKKVPDGEPFYVRQHGAFAQLNERQGRKWFQTAHREAKKEGAVWLRYSVDNALEPTMALVEGWKVRPKNEGEIRWQLTLSNDGKPE
jgi:hypothetical protein